MNQREKVLAMGVGVVVLLAGGQYIWNGVKSGFAAKQARIDSLKTQTMNEELTVTAGMVASRDMNKLVKRSLPSDIESAKTIYNEWLIKFSAESKLKSANHQYVRDTAEPNVYHLLRYSLEGETDLVAAIQMLYRFYEHPFLHKITDVKITPLPAYGNVKVAISIEVLALDSASPEQAVPQVEEFKKDLRPVGDYVTAIANRNVFWPANRPPTWSEKATTSVTQNAQLGFELGAKDPDDGQNVHYELVSSTADGLKLEGNRLVWQPSELGKFSAVVRAIDNGLPQATSQQTVSIDVSAPAAPTPPAAEAPKFDVATQTRLTALLSGRDGPQAWIKSRLEDKTSSLMVGDDLDMAGIKGKVTEIGRTYIQFETDGKTWIMGQDESLADAYRRGQED